MSVQGYRGTIQIDGDALCVKRINANETADDLDTTSTCITIEGENNVGFETRIPGVKRMEMTVEADYAAGGAGDPPACEVGDTVQVDALVGYTIAGNFVVLGFTYTLEVKGLIAYTMTLKSTGVYTVAITVDFGS